MIKISATQAKQKFSEALIQAESAPVQIERHGKVVAMMVPAHYVTGDIVERRLARAQQEKIESERLIRHQKIAIHLLSEKSEWVNRRVGDARKVVDRWERESLCSEDFISRWRDLLSLPPKVLAHEMCKDLEGWGKALRQNSPWVGLV